ncbi:MAG: hypothetical protein CM15mP49_14180 [Actinomycetota bacterium]|nr:MAG: hypothetical protein CM15mP49_14180 [Actinomycetota bacterium]
MTVVCGDSHTSTHGAFGALAFGIGTSEVEHVLATQTLPQPVQETMSITINGELPEGSTAKDVVLAILNEVGTGGGIGAIAEFRGSVVENLSMEGRMTLCNMSIEFGAKAGLIAPDEVTYEYLKGLENCPKGENWDEAVAYWNTLFTDHDAILIEKLFLMVQQFRLRSRGEQIRPGHSCFRLIPDPQDYTDPAEREAAERALDYMGLQAGSK